MADSRFRVAGPKAEHAAKMLTEELARRIALRGDVASLLVLFEDRVATLELGRMLARELERRWGSPLPVLAIRRDGKELSLCYYESSESAGEKMSLLSPATRARIEEAQVLLFADLLRAGDHEGTLRVLRAPAVHRHRVKVLGIATLAVAEAGTRKRFREVVGNEQFPIHLLMHFGERLSSHKAAENGEKKGVVADLLRRAFGDSSAP